MTLGRCASSSYVNTVFGPVSALNYRIFPEVSTKKECCNKAGVVTTSQSLTMILMLMIIVSWLEFPKAQKASPSLNPLPFMTYIHHIET